MYSEYQSRYQNNTCTWVVNPEGCMGIASQSVQFAPTRQPSNASEQLFPIVETPGVITPYRESRLFPSGVEQDEFTQRLSSHANWQAYPMACLPRKSGYVTPDGSYDNFYPHVPQEALWYKTEGNESLYVSRRFSEESALVSCDDDVDELRLVRARKVSVGGNAGAIEADAKLLLEATASFRSTVSSCPFADKLDGCELVSLDLYGSVPDALFLAMGQMKLCRLTDEDRFGNYRHRPIGMIGLACKHCGGLSGFGRHFPSSFQSLLSGSHCGRIVKHVRSECRACPQETRQCMLELEQKAYPSSDHGARKRFISFVWSRLQNASGNRLLEARDSCIINDEELDAAADDSLTSAFHDADHTIPWETILCQTELVEAKDRYLVPDSTIYAVSQMKLHPLGKEDQTGRHKEQEIGFMGMCCAHCGGKAGKPRYGRYFPSCLKTLAKPASCDRIVNHLSNECPSCPTETKIILHKLQMRELLDSKRFGSRNIFFQRLWNRLHRDPCGTSESLVEASHSTSSESPDELTEDSWECLLNGSLLVSKDDIGLVPNSQLASMAQLAPCRLKDEDRIAWYKDRDIGFGGLACRHCGGRRGVGRYFPNSLRTFSQNNYCQIVRNHIEGGCPACPDEIRILLSATLTSESKRFGTSPRDSTYIKGSRKSFYERIWLQIHSTNPSLIRNNNLDRDDESFVTLKAPKVGDKRPWNQI